MIFLLVKLIFANQNFFWKETITLLHYSGHPIYVVSHSKAQFLRNAKFLPFGRGRTPGPAARPRLRGPRRSRGPRLRPRPRVPRLTATSIISRRLATFGLPWPPSSHLSLPFLMFFVGRFLGSFFGWAVRPLPFYTGLAIATFTRFALASAVAFTNCR